MCDIDLEPCDVWSEVERTARKAHRCSACGGPIRSGERYTVHFSKYEGEVCSAKMCVACGAARQEFAEAHGSDYGSASLCQPPALVGFLRDCIADGDDESETRWKPMLTAILARRPKP